MNIFSSAAGSCISEEKHSRHLDTQIGGAPHDIQ